MTKTAPAPWRNRIVGTGDEAPDQLVANPANWRMHPGPQRDALRGSLSEVGWVQQVMVNRRTGFVVDGHARVEEALTRGEPTVPVLYVDLDPEEEALVLATLDPIGAMATRDDAKLRELLAGITVDDAGLKSLLGDLAGNVETAGLTDPDDVPDLEPSTIKAGDLFALGDHRLMCGDSTKAEDVARLMDGALADLTFTDPPYGVGYDGGAKKRDKLDGDQVGTTIYADALPHLRAAAADHAALYLWYAGAAAAAAAAAAEGAGYVISAQIVWVKNNAQFVSAAKYHGKHEPCFYAHRKGKTAAWYGGNNEVTVWEEDRAPSNDYHPTQKPVALAERAIRNSSAPGNVVLDLFNGSGSTIIAAEQLGRRCYAMEIDPRYVAVAIKRWEQFTGKTAEQI